MTRRRESHLDILLRLGAAGPDCSEDDVVRMYTAARGYFRQLLVDAPDSKVTALLTKYNDAGPYKRRSQNRPQSGDSKPREGGANLDRPGGPRSIPEVFCGTPEGCIKWSYTLKYGGVSSLRG